MKPPPIIILLATRNGAAHLDRQLESYLEQDYANWALWASDDGSDDATWNILQGFAATHPDRNIRLLRGPRRGAAANFLSLLTHPDLPSGAVALSDQDDVWMPHRLSQGWVAIGNEAGPALYAAPTIETRPDLTPLPRQRRALPGPSFANAMVQNIVAGNTITLNAPALEALRAAGRRDVPYHDWWIYLRLAAIGARIELGRRPVLYYRQHEGNVIGAHSGVPARLTRARALLDGTYGNWVRANLTALLAAPDDLVPAHAEAARLLLETSPRIRALKLSGARRSGALGQTVLKALALAGRV